jgi:hypothetical protein
MRCSATVLLFLPKRFFTTISVPFTVEISRPGRERAIALSADQFQAFIVHAISSGKIGSTGYILPSTSNITIINNTNPIPPLG